MKSGIATILGSRVRKRFAGSLLGNVSYYLEKHMPCVKPLPNEDESKALLNELSEKPQGGGLRDLSESWMSSSVDLSVIIPAYKVEKYLGDCLHSVESQVFNGSFEIIVIDDGSPDRTGVIADEFASKNNNMRVIHQENKGFSGARNVGIDVSNGRWITFVDSDDMLPNDAFSNLLSAAEKNPKANLISGNWSKMSEDGSQVRLAESIRTHGAPWGRLFGRELFSRIRFPEGYWFEDTVFAFCLEPLSNQAVINSSVYLRRNNPSSIVHTSKNSYKSLDSYWIIEELLRWCEVLGIPLDSNLYFNVLSQLGPILYERTRLLNEEERRALFVVCRKLLLSLKRPDGALNGKSAKWHELERSLIEGNYRCWVAACRWMG